MQQLYLFRGNNALAIVDTNKKQIKLKKDGTVKKTCQNKKKGKSSTVDHLEIEDMRKIAGYFRENDKWLPYLAFVLSCNMARRIGDTLALTWENFYNPTTGQMRENLMEIVEDKTDKLASPRINAACRNAVMLYIEKTGCNPSAENYTLPVFLQLSGNYKGRVMSDSGYLKNLKKAAEATGIKANVGTHSPRKTFGMLSRMIHPADHDSMEILQTIFNHSDDATTRRYIGLTKEKINKYYDDAGDFFEEYIVGGKQYTAFDSYIVNITADDLRSILSLAYESGKNNANETNPIAHIEAMNELLALVDSVKK